MVDLRPYAFAAFPIPDQFVPVLSLAPTAFITLDAWTGSISLPVSFDAAIANAAGPHPAFPIVSPRPVSYGTPLHLASF